MTGPRTTSYGEGVGLIEQLLEAAPSAMVVFRRDHAIRHVNPRLLELFGYGREELVGQPLETLVPERVRVNLAEQLEEYLGDGHPEGLAYRPDFWAARKDGSEFPMQYIATPLHGPEGLWVVVTVFDVSEYRASEQRVQRLKRAYLTLARMNEAVIQSPDVPTLYADTCRVAVEQGGFLASWVGQRDADGRIRPVASAGPLDDVIATINISADPDSPRGNAPTAVALREEHPVYVREVADHQGAAPWRALAADYGIRALVCLPLRRGGRTVAVLTMYADGAEAFDEEAGQLLEGLARGVSFALDSFESEERLQQVAAQRRELLARLVSAQETERSRIAADIHDESVQALAAIDLRLGLVERQVPDVAPHLQDGLRRVRELLAGATASLRELMFDLEPPEPDLLLSVSLTDAAAHVFLGLDVRCHVEAEEVRMAEVQLGQALRITKEALINVRKHAGATHAWIRVRADSDGAHFEVSDDGVGFEEGAAIRVQGHRGLQTMRERAETAGGWLRVEPAAEGGAQVTYWLPADGGSGL